MKFLLGDAFIIYILPGIMFTVSSFFLIWTGRYFFSQSILFKRNINRVSSLDDKKLHKAAFRTALGIGLLIVGVGLLNDGIEDSLIKLTDRTIASFIGTGLSLIIIFVFGLLLYHKIRIEG